MNKRSLYNAPDFLMILRRFNLETLGLHFAFQIIEGKSVTTRSEILYSVLDDRDDEFIG